MATNIDLYFDRQLATAADSKTVNTILRLATEGTLRLRPAFQRNMVWAHRQQALLIDSMLRGVPVPEIYLQTKTGPDGEEESIVVDGQQRISAVLAYLGGEFQLLGEPDSRPEWAGKRFADLAPEMRQRLREFRFVTRDLASDLEDQDVRAIFQRLNMTVESLEPQELRHAAYTGAFIELVERTAALDVFPAIGVFSSRDYLRRSNDEFISEVYFALYARTLPNKKEDLDDLYATFERNGLPQADADDLSRRMGRLVGVLTPIAADLRRTRFRNKSDLYSLMFRLGSDAEHLRISEDFSRQLLSHLVEFSETIKAYRDAGDDEAARAAVVHTRFGEAASAYSAAVARAASDRKPREVRDHALGEVLADLLNAEPARPLTSEDAAWLDFTPEAVETETAPDEDVERAREVTQSVIDNA